MVEFSNLGTSSPGTGSLLGGVPVTASSGQTATLYPIGLVFSVGFEAQSAIGTTSLTGTDTIPVSHGGTVYSATLSEVLAGAGGISGIEVSNGTTTYNGITELVLEGGTVTHSSNTVTFVVTGGGGSGTIELTDGTHTLTAASEIVVSGGTISGSNPTGTLTIPTASGGYGYGLTRPALSSFTASNTNTLVTATDVSGGPIQILYEPTGTYLSITNWNQAVTGTEWLLTAEIVQGQFAGYLGGNDYCTVGVGVKASNGNFFNIRLLGIQQEIDFITFTSETSYANDLGDFTEPWVRHIWIRIYYQSSDTSYPFKVFSSVDGNTWNYIYQWNGTSGLSTALSPASCCFFVDSGGSTLPSGGCVYHWDIQEGTGSSLNPYGIVNPR